MGSGPLALIRWDDPVERERVLRRGLDRIFDPGLRRQVREVLDDVRARGDVALVRALAEFDGCRIEADRLQVSEAEVELAYEHLDAPLLDAIRHSIANVRAYNERLLGEREWQMETDDGFVVGARTVPIASAGLYVPAGKGSFPSVALHLGTAASVAGVPSIVAVVPPGRDGQVDPATIVAAHEAGVHRLFRLNGVAGIGALAYGTETVPQVVKVVGPGSPPVQAAQIEVQADGCVSVMAFGPSESLAVADDSADPELLAADLLTEAEHGPDSTVLLVTPSRALLDTVQDALARPLAELPEPRRAYATAALGELGGAVVVADLDEAVSVANEFAPEHLQLVVEESAALLQRLTNAGEILVGQATPFAAANYSVGVPSALPTSGFARVSSGITARTFTRTISVAQGSGDALHSLGPRLVTLAEQEGFPAHAAAIRARLDDP